MKKMRPPKPQTVWAYYNFERLIGFAASRMAAIKTVEAELNVSWSEASEYMQVLKVTVAPRRRAAPSAKPEGDGGER